MPTRLQANWVDQAASVPLAFAQVREDPSVDLAILKRLGRHLTAVMIASGGCNACALAASGRLQRLTLVDPNSAQLALSRFKLALLRSDTPETRCRLLGHLPMDPKQRFHEVSRRLTKLGLEIDLFGDRELWSRLGLDHSGRYELLFSALVEAMGSVGLQRAFTSVMSQQNLVRLFGLAATANRAREFSEHFYERTRHELAGDPGCSGPYLSQMLRGGFTDSPYFWLEQAPRFSSLPEILWEQAFMLEALHGMQTESVDFVHLSNILDWLTAHLASSTLEQARRVLRPGGLLVVRQLNSTLKVRRLPVGIEWLGEFSEQLHRRDRSFFYRELHVGRKPL